MLPMYFSNGEVHAISWSTRRPGGFGPVELAAFAAVTPAFARATEIYALRRTAVTFLDTYVGHGAGARILSGQIQRGEVQEIDAVILAADLRGFSGYATRHDGAQVVERLNAFFDRLVPPIAEQAGEVLKFTGDGLLAMFPFEAEADLGQRCRDALSGAQAAQTAIAGLGDDTEIDEAIRCGIALHPGRVLFGNVGTESRLDFTAIGEAVNLAARLETVAGELGRDIVVSANFMRAEGGAYTSLGHFALKGFEGEREVFAPAKS
ncbi:MAG: adenylate/guanylate cyclase domain-containing protein [Alphaproteobacteria bacterium]|jgi:adenylate cyclase|nr:adenylate/guanylate cyclase domain-containing protein [Alphaproteobacteria bacterium]MDP6830718.1 adenylate/guanylate cyclase domain-containing protein [Alphaproteobacteria bacterium]